MRTGEGQRWEEASDGEGERLGRGRGWREQTKIKKKNECDSTQ